MSAKSASSYEKVIIELLRNKGGTIRGGRDNLPGYLASVVGITVRGVAQERVVRALLYGMQKKGILVVETMSASPRHIVALHLTSKFKRSRRHTRRKPKQN